MYKSVSFQDEIPKMTSIAKLSKKATMAPVAKELDRKKTNTSKKLGNVLE